MKRKKPIVAIDGPAGSGKTTVSRRVAERLGYFVLDTGALYRTLALATRRAGLDPRGSEIGPFCQALVARDAITLTPEPSGGARVLLDAEDVSTLIRTPEMSELASIVSAVPEVRSALLVLQRSIGQGGGVVVEGRDIGSVVFPDAEAKFFLTASLDRRALRRFTELAVQPNAPSLSIVRDQVVERDRRDSERATAPLSQARDAELMDSSDLTVDEVVEHIVQAVRSLEARLQSDADA